MSWRPAKAFSLLELVTTTFLVGLLSVGIIFAYQEIFGSVSTREAEGHINRVVSAQQNFAGVYGKYTPFPADLSGMGRNLTVVAGRSKRSGEVSISVGEKGTLGVAALDDRGRCSVRRVSSLEDGSESTKVAFTPSAVCDGRAALPDGEPPIAATSAAF